MIVSPAFYSLNSNSKFLVHLMKMWFHGGASEVILFKWWKVESYTGKQFLKTFYKYQF